jgi:hypothetical protein
VAQITKSSLSPQKTIVESNYTAAQIARWPVLGRGLADSRDRVEWAKARAPRIGASDAAGFAKLESTSRYVASKLFNPFEGNFYTRHGNEREPVMLAAYGLEQNFTLFRSAENDLHVATPDSIKLGVDGAILLAQAKTSVKPLWKIPPAYQRQMWWEHYVMGTDRTLFIWEEHKDGQPVEMEPRAQLFYRNDEKIAELIVIANRVLEAMAEAAGMGA